MALNMRGVCREEVQLCDANPVATRESAVVPSRNPESAMPYQTEHFELSVHAIKGLHTGDYRHQIDDRFRTETRYSLDPTI